MQIITDSVCIMWSQLQQHSVLIWKYSLSENRFEGRPNEYRDTDKILRLTLTLTQEETSWGWAVPSSCKLRLIGLWLDFRLLWFFYIAYIYRFLRIWSKNIFEQKNLGPKNISSIRNLIENDFGKINLKSGLNMSINKI